jgi:hypothetical protein
VVDCERVLIFNTSTTRNPLSLLTPLLLKRDLEFSHILTAPFDDESTSTTYPSLPDLYEKDPSLELPLFPGAQELFPIVDCPEVCAQSRHSVWQTTILQSAMLLTQCRHHTSSAICIPQLQSLQSSRASAPIFMRCGSVQQALSWLKIRSQRQPRTRSPVSYVFYSSVFFINLVIFMQTPGSYHWLFVFGW